MMGRGNGYLLVRIDRNKWVGLDWIGLDDRRTSLMFELSRVVGIRQFVVRSECSSWYSVSVVEKAEERRVRIK